MTDKVSPTATSVPSPTTGVDPRVALATAVHAAPGVYAVLVGSGMSSAAGVPTGWQVVQDLIRRVAKAEGVDPDELGDKPELWWAAKHRPEPRYDTLLAALASTDAARQSLLRDYFDPPPKRGGPIRPTLGHQALAKICAAGRIRVILTTNFDRLIEHALDQVGLTPQVVASPSAISGMIPLRHSPATVVKLHGDYAVPGLRNTPEELQAYDATTESLLAQVFDEYGLLVIGWSADYDIGLAATLAGTRSRRYPVFWTSHNDHLGESARRLIANRSATVIGTTSADEFLVDLGNRLNYLDQVAIRRDRPTLMRITSLQPQQAGVQTGWALTPLLQLRVAAAVGPAPLDRCDLIRPRHRSTMVKALNSAPLTTGLRALESIPAADASAIGAPLETRLMAPALSEWEPTPGYFQTTDHASYRLGGDGSVGVSALASLRLPQWGIQGGVAVFTLDLGISLGESLPLAVVALLLRDSLVLATDTLPSLVTDVLPPDAWLNRVELHILADTTDGKNAPRPNDLLDRVDLSQLGFSSRPVGPLLSFGAELSRPLGEVEAAGLVVDAFEFLALSHGYLDPEAGVAKLRSEVGLSSSRAE